MFNNDLGEITEEFIEFEEVQHLHNYSQEFMMNNVKYTFGPYEKKIVPSGFSKIYFPLVRVVRIIESRVSSSQIDKKDLNSVSLGTSNGEIVLVHKKGGKGRPRNISNKPSGSVPDLNVPQKLERGYNKLKPDSKLKYKYIFENINTGERIVSFTPKTTGDELGIPYDTIKKLALTGYIFNKTWKIFREEKTSEEEAEYLKAREIELPPEPPEEDVKNSSHTF